jgi:hypothetical protein
LGETRVDLFHLLEDLRDAYTGSLEETLLTEIVANSLDSGADWIALETDPTRSTLIVRDNGAGMQRRDLARYHDIASSTKSRGEGIGFAGVGIKLGLLACERVTTETRRGKTHVASEWRLASRHRAPWKWVPPAGAVPERGTAVTLTLSNPLSPLLDAGFLESTLRRHYQPMLEPDFIDILAAHYPDSVRFTVNGRGVELEPPLSGEIAHIEVRMGRKRKPSAIGYLALASAPLPEDLRGLAVCTLGKVIRRGWDWLGVTPTAPDRIGGVVEVPALAECLTLNKSDFVRTGTRGATWLSYRKALQEVVSRQLALWGAERDKAEQTRRRAARPVERDLERVLVDLADDFPLLASLVERKEGGQRRLPIGGPGDALTGRGLTAAGVMTGGEADALEPSTQEAGPATATLGPPVSSNGDAQAGHPAAPPDADGSPAPIESLLSAPATRGVRKPARYALAIQFETREGEHEVARLVESTVWVNDAHPAYRRAAASRSEGYHLAFCVAMALAPLAVQAFEERAFVGAFMEKWGEALETKGSRRRREW